MTRYLAPLVVFVVAVGIRLGYALAFPHDSATSLLDDKALQAGQELAKVLNSSPNFATFTETLTRAAGTGSNLPAVSDGLIERLLSYGPVYPFYIAAITLFFKGTLLNGALDSYYVILSVADAILGGLTALLVYHCGRLALERRSGLTAGLLFACYPGSIVSVGLARPELLNCLILTFWTSLCLSALLRHTPFWRRCLTFVLLGLASGLLMLSGPIFMLMPPLMAICLFCIHAVPRLQQLQQEAEKMTGTESGATAVPAPSAISAPAQEVVPAIPDQPAEAVAETSTATEAASDATATEAVTDVPATEAAADAAESQEPSQSTPPEVAKSVLNFSPEDVQNVEAEVETTARAEDEVEASTTAAASDTSATPPDPPPVKVIPEQQIESKPPLAAPEPKFSAGEIDKYNQWWNRLIIFAAAFGLGFSAIVLPWVQYGRAFSNNPFVSLEQLISNEILYGSQLSYDGWKLIPPTSYYAEGLSAIVHRLLASLVVNPVHYTELLLRKIPRLWAGSWNDYQQSFFGIDPHMQSAWHALLLYAAWIGLAIILLRYKRWRRSRSVKGGIVLALVPLFHMAYILLSPVSSMTLTAMPIVCLLAGFTVLRVLDIRKSKRLAAWGPFLFAICFFYLLDSHVSFVPQFVSIFPNALGFLDVSRACDCGLWLLGWALFLSLTLGIVTALTGRTNTIAGDVIKFVFACAAFLTVTWSAFDFGWQEWSVDLKNNRQQIDQYLYVPPIAEITEISSEQSVPRTVFVLIDLESPMIAPPIVVSLNGTQSRMAPMPWLQVRPTDAVVTQTLARQGRGMGRDFRSIRQWWACPIPSTALKFGEVNTITINILQSDWLPSYRFFGNYGSVKSGKADPYKILPSLYYMSLDKGFHSFDDRDPRLLESIALAGNVSGGTLSIGSEKQQDDLSFARGKQTGAFRVRLALPNSNVFGLPQITTQPITRIMISDLPLYTKDEPVVSQGSDPATMQITPFPLKLPSDLPSQAVLSLRCELSTAAAKGEASVSVVLSGMENGKQVTWSSDWQPAVTAVTNDWRSYSFCDMIPERILRLNDLTVQVFVTPCQSTLANTNPEWARQQSVNIRMIRLAVMPPIDMPAPGERDWLIF